MTAKLHLVYFSPSGSTEKVVRAVASGIEGVQATTIDLLTPSSRKKRYTFGPEDIVIMGMMTAGKLFALSDEVFACLEGDGTPFVGVVTYGNGYYGIALTEMLRRAESRGFSVAAMAAFIAQHTISPNAGAGRPDAEDVRIMRDFGRDAYAKILGGDLTLHVQPKTNWASFGEGNKIVAYREANPDVPYTIPASFKTKIITDDCVKCGTCVRHCPVNAIDIEAKTFDLDACIGCWGCINRCPKHAIISTSQEMADIMRNFAAGFEARREPDIFM